MTTYAWPNWLRPSACTLSLQPNLRRFESPFSRAVQTVDLLGERWRMTVAVPPRMDVASGALEAFLHGLRGVHTVAAWHFAREVPTGTLRGAPVATAVVQGDSSITLIAAPGATLRAGDLFGLGGMLFMTRDDAVAGADGRLYVNTVNRARRAVASGGAVTWYRPTATFRVLDDAVPISHLPGHADGLQLDLMETW